MNYEKMMCDRLGYKYRRLFNHLEFILNTMNMLLNTYGVALSDEELKMLNELVFKLETGKIEIIEFTRPIEKCFDLDVISKENKELKAQLECLQTQNKQLLKKSYIDDVRITKVIEEIDKVEEHCITPIFNIRGFLNDIKNTLKGGDEVVKG